MSFRVAAFLMLIVCCTAKLSAHSGRTDANGGHHDYQNGGYHFHNSGGVGDIPVPMLSMAPMTYKPDARAVARSQARKKARIAASAERKNDSARKKSELEQRRKPARYAFHHTKLNPFMVLEFDDGGDHWDASDVYSRPIRHEKNEITRIENLVAKDDFRTWVDSTGAFSLVAALVSFDDPEVKLRKLDDGVVALRLSQLSEYDQNYLKYEFKPHPMD